MCVCVCVCSCAGALVKHFMCLHKSWEIDQCMSHICICEFLCIPGNVNYEYRLTHSPIRSVQTCIALLPTCVWVNGPLSGYLSVPSCRHSHTSLNRHITVTSYTSYTQLLPMTTYIIYASRIIPSICRAAYLPPMHHYCLQQEGY